MKHFLILAGFEFYMTSGVNQDDNVEHVLKRMDKKNLRGILRAATSTRAKMGKVIRNNPVLSKLLGKILLCASDKLVKS